MSEERPLRDRIQSPEFKPGALIGTALRLGVVSLIVGAVLVIFGINPVKAWEAIFNGLEEGVVDIFGTGIEGISLVVTLIATGAVIVIPIWLVGKLLSLRK